MIFGKITPEAAGIESKHVYNYVSALERHGCTTHSLLLLKGNDIFAEYYWAPFNEDSLHRMYSQTKSYVSIAIGLLEEEGKLSINDRIIDHFPEKIDTEVPEYLRDQTIRDMLMMSTSLVAPYWFHTANHDRTHEYLNQSDVKRPSGTLWEYDSPGSQVMSSLVEKITGMSLLDYLKKKIFNEIGSFKTARVLKSRNDDSWGDSALLCTTRDMASCARFVMNYGTWGGKRLMNEKYLREATARQCDNSDDWYDACFRYGYGYQIWKTAEDGFAFVGMGDQLTVALPYKDLIMVITSDNQFSPATRELIVDYFFDYIAANVGNEPKEENKEDAERLKSLTDNLKLRIVDGATDSPITAKISGKRFACEENPMGISEFSLTFNGDEGELRYVNAQGEKELPFGLGKNVISRFPQLGYSTEHGGLRTTDGSTYRCATSAAFREENKLLMRCHIIDNYLGNMTAIFSFKGDKAVLRMVSNAEDFMQEYKGETVATLAD